MVESDYTNQYKHISANDVKSMINVSSAFGFWLQNKNYNALKAVKVGFDKLNKTGQLQTLWDMSILKTHEVALEHTFIYIYEAFKNMGNQLSKTAREELNGVLKDNGLEDILKLNNLNQDALLKKIRESFAHNDETQDEANREYTITGNIFGRRIKLPNGYVEISNMALYKIINVLIHDLSTYEENRTINIICNNDNVFALLNFKGINAENFEEFIKLQDDETHTILHLDKAQRQGFVDYLTYFKDSGLSKEKLLCDAYSSVRLDVHERALEIYNEMLYIGEFSNAVERAMPYNKFVSTCANDLHKPAQLVEKEALFVLTNLTITQFFKILSTNTTLSLQGVFADLNLSMEQLNRVRNSIMHGRYFRHNTTVEFYDGKDNNSYWTHIASLDMCKIEECIEKFSLNFEKEIEDYIDEMHEKGMDIGDSIRLG